MHIAPDIFAIGGQLDKQEFFRKYPKLAGLKRQYRYAFCILAQCMPPCPNQISKSDLNKLAKALSTGWERLPKQMHSERIGELIKFELFAPDCLQPRFIYMTPRGEEFKAVVVAEFPELTQTILAKIALMEFG